MSVMTKIKELGKTKKRDLVKLKEEITEKQLELGVEKDQLLEEVIVQRKLILDSDEKEESPKWKKEREKLEMLEKMYGIKCSAFKENLETLKAIEQIFEIRDKRKTSVCTRIYGLFGVLIGAGGIGLAYGSDTFSTLVNKKTLEAAKTTVTRFLPKL